MTRSKNTAILLLDLKADRFIGKWADVNPRAIAWLSVKIELIELVRSSPPNETRPKSKRCWRTRPTSFKNFTQPIDKDYRYHTMKRKSRQEHSRSREARRESTARGRRIQSATDLTNSPDFDLQYGDEWGGGSPCDYYTLQYRGHKAHLRFSYMWMVKVPSLGIEGQFLNQTPNTLAQEIENWIDAHIEPPTTSSHAKVRQATPAVQGLTARHNITITLADEMMLERGQ